MRGQEDFDLYSLERFNGNAHRAVALQDGDTQGLLGRFSQAEAVVANLKAETAQLKNDAAELRKSKKIDRIIIVCLCIVIVLMIIYGGFLTKKVYAKKESWWEKPVSFIVNPLCTASTSVANAINSATGCIAHIAADLGFGPLRLAQQ
jgi:hypothetical protein